MTRAALYCRYSSDAQNDTSIEDQARLLEARAASEGWKIVASFADRAISGSTMVRPGIQELLAQAATGAFDVVLSESVDRLSRDIEDIAHMHKRLNWRGIRIVTLLEGEVSELHVGLKGTMSQLYLKDLARRTHRGLEGRALVGESTGGKAYGYDVTPRYDEKGKRIGGLISINEDEAAIAVRIAKEFAYEKHSPKAIAIRLNREGIPSQGGRAWGASTIYGNRERGTGILNNQLYVGVKVWNRQRFTTNPDTGRTNGRLNDPSKWIRVDVPHLRIWSEELWAAVKARQEEMKLEGDFRGKRRPKRLFSFLLKCGECGGGYARSSNSHYSCSTYRNKGTCGNRLMMSEKVLRASVLGALDERLMQPELCDLFCKVYTHHINALQREAVSGQANAKAELAGLERKIARLVEAIQKGVDPALIKDEINSAQERKLKLTSELSTPRPAPVFVHPAMAQRYSKAIRDLIEALDVPELEEEASERVRSVIEKIVLTPNAERSDLVVDLYGDLAGILHLASRSKTAPKGRAEAGWMAAALELEQVQSLACTDGLCSHQTEKFDLEGTAGWGGRIRTCECRYQNPGTAFQANRNQWKSMGLGSLQCTDSRSRENRYTNRDTSAVVKELSSA